MTNFEKIRINNFNLGGIADSKYAGVQYSLSKLVGVDVHTEPGVAKANYKMVLEASSEDDPQVIDGLVNAIIPVSGGDTYLFGKDNTDGAVWKRTSAGVYSLSYSRVVSNSRNAGAFVYGGYIYFASADKLHRIAIADLANNDWATDVDENWATFTNNISWHPMIVVNNVLYIGDGNTISQVEDTTFSANALDLPEDYSVKCLAKAFTNLVIGTIINRETNRCSIFDWNTWSVSWSNEDELFEAGINSFLKADNFIIVNGGLVGNLYSYNLQEASKVKKIPGEYKDDQKMLIEPNSVAELNGLSLFGVGQQYGAASEFGNATEHGIYGFGAPNPMYPKILTLEYPIYKSDGSMVTSDLVIQSLGTNGNTLIASWEYNEGEEYGVSALDYDQRSNGAYFDLKVVRGERDRQRTIKSIAVCYVEIPTSTSITVKYKVNYQSSWQTLTLKQDIVNSRYYADVDFLFNTFELRVIFNTNGADTPVIDEVIMEVL